MSAVVTASDSGLGVLEAGVVDALGPGLALVSGAVRGPDGIADAAADSGRAVDAAAPRSVVAVCDKLHAVRRAGKNGAIRMCAG